jgi:hypothetical protein
MSPLGFYSDLKPTNILMVSSDQILSTLLIDFELVCAWFSWSPPEVYYLSYIQHLARERPRISNGKFQGILDDYLALFEQPLVATEAGNPYAGQRLP